MSSHWVEMLHALAPESLGDNVIQRHVSHPWQAQHASYYTSTMTSGCSTVDAQRAFQRFFLESSEADVVDSESTSIRTIVDDVSDQSNSEDVPSFSL